MRLHLAALTVALVLASASAAALEGVTAFLGTPGSSLAEHLTRTWLELPLPDCGGRRRTVKWSEER